MIQVKVLNHIFGSIPAITVIVLNSLSSSSVSRNDCRKMKWKQPQDLNQNLSPAAPGWLLNRDIFSSEPGDGGTTFRLAAFHSLNTSHKHCYVKFSHLLFTIIYFATAHQSEVENQAACSEPAALPGPRALKVTEQGWLHFPSCGRSHLCTLGALWSSPAQLPQLTFISGMVRQQLVSPQACGSSPSEHEEGHSLPPGATSSSGRGQAMPKCPFSP